MPALLTKISISLHTLFISTTHLVTEEDLDKFRGNIVILTLYFFFKSEINF